MIAAVCGTAVTPAAALSARVDALPGEPAAASGTPPAPPARPTAKPKPRSTPRAAPQVRRPIPPWIFGRGAEPRLVPPRSIPAGRTARPPSQASRPADTAERTPARGSGTGGAGDPATTASTRPSTPATGGPKPKLPPRAPGAIDVPVAPLD
ncbi:hypothetical protein [Rhodoplanes sp. SY1]|uniref:hypothetical protein n=1 Tax=Rhodoplanes sp. SY1 TaxID=3166646 RepID=UPI0038B59EED